MTEVTNTHTHTHTHTHTECDEIRSLSGTTANVVTKAESSDFWTVGPEQVYSWTSLGFAGGASSKEPACQLETTGLLPGSGR